VSFVSTFISLAFSSVAMTAPSSLRRSLPTACARRA